MKKQTILGAMGLTVLMCCLTTGCNTMPPITDDGDYTVMLASFTNPWGATADGELLHIHQAKVYKQQTEADTHWPKLFIISEANTSTLYWGHYKSIDDAQPYLRKAKDYRTPMGAQVFAQAVIVPVPGKTVQEHNEWNIENAPGEWTVLVSVYFDEPNPLDEKGNSAPPYYGHRDRRAIQVCKELRQKGYDAFYYYGKNRSAVTIGAFPAGSVDSAKTTDQMTGATQMPGKIINQDMIRICKEFPNILVNELGVQTEVREISSGKTKPMLQETFGVRIRDFRSKDAGSVNTIGQPQRR